MADLAIPSDLNLNPPLVLGNPSYGDVTRKVAGIVENRTPRAWYVAISITGGITLLLQDAAGGLQVWDTRQQRWIDAPPVPGAFVVNIGDLFARWTNDRYVSTLHRVINVSGRERYSVPFFFTGNLQHPVACLPTCLAPGETPKYPVVTVEAHQIACYRRTYG